MEEQNVPLHRCKNSDQEQFHPASGSSYSALLSRWELLMLCFDNRNEVNLMNKWEATKGKVLHFNIEKCSGEYVECAPEEEID